MGMDTSKSFKDESIKCFYQGISYTSLIEHQSLATVHSRVLGISSCGHLAKKALQLSTAAKDLQSAVLCVHTLGNHPNLKKFLGQLNSLMDKDASFWELWPNFNSQDPSTW